MSVERVAALSPASAEGWACCPGNTGPGSDGKCLQDKDMLFFSPLKQVWKEIRKSRREGVMALL